MNYVKKYIFYIIIYFLIIKKKSPKNKINLKLVEAKYANNK